MVNALAALEPFVANQPELVWGGDWNQSLGGKESVGSLGDRAALLSMGSVCQASGLGAPNTA